MNMTDAFAQPYFIDIETDALRVPSLGLVFVKWGTRLHQDEVAAWSEVQNNVSRTIRERLLAKTYVEPLIEEDGWKVITPNLSSRIMFNILREMNKQNVTFKDLELMWSRKYKRYTPLPISHVEESYFRWLFESESGLDLDVIEDILTFLKVNAEIGLTSLTEPDPQT